MYCVRVEVIAVGELRPDVLFTMLDSGEFRPDNILAASEFESE
jgi:hypothetical protein